MSAVIYARFSPRPEAETSQSIEQQLESCRGYCERQGYVVRGEYQDAAKSGSDAAREGLWAAVEALRRGDVLVVHKPDRLARDLYLSEYIGQAVKKRGARIETVEGGMNGESPEAVLLRQVLNAFAEFERKVISARTKLAMRRRQANGERMSSHAPYGFRIDPDDPKRIVPNEEERAAIEQIKVLHGRGWSYRRIAARLTLDRPDVCRGRRWDANAVGRILHRESDDA